MTPDAGLGLVGWLTRHHPQSPPSSLSWASSIASYGPPTSALIPAALPCGSWGHVQPGDPLTVQIRS